jgi:hypothetical protein
LNKLSQLNFKLSLFFVFPIFWGVALKFFSLKFHFKISTFVSTFWQSENWTPISRRAFRVRSCTGPESSWKPGPFSRQFFPITDPTTSSGMWGCPTGKSLSNWRCQSFKWKSFCYYNHLRKLLIETHKLQLKIVTFFHFFCAGCHKDIKWYLTAYITPGKCLINLLMQQNKIFLNFLQHHGPRILKNTWGPLFSICAWKI